MVIYNGGTFYIDAGKPTPALIGRDGPQSARVSPTWYFNVPAGYELLIRAMRTTRSARDRFFSRLKLMMYAGAGLAQHTWDRAGTLASGDRRARAFGDRPRLDRDGAVFASACTETATARQCRHPGTRADAQARSGRGQARGALKGPNITPGYWREPH